ncbi:glycosyltransferase family 2 protein [Microbacterium hominis]|uniref:Glycosyltransferase family 2 protein n=1 Tax=Microbacterium hominis TaxID=162426 RepID=A0A7D4Q2C4_9MICO|nr:glycosyltransferase family 2 protein [Microbacterium hominis]QKJ20232.1 glycosyltransferase family 2 protein [Microbacterium hominis]
MPAHNEAEGIAGFLDEIAEHLHPICDTLSIVVVDDTSTDATAEVLDDWADADSELHVIHAPVNRGHGPTALAAYRAGLDLDPEVIVHVDGDGQFLGADIARVAAALHRLGADVVHGVRRERSDPWFRRAITAFTAATIALAAGRQVPDVNTPLRAYRPAVVRELLAQIPAEAIIPHVHFSLLEVRRGYGVRYVSVRSLPRRGGDANGTMWGATPARPKLPPARLRRFVRDAAVELWRVSLSPGRAG